MPRSVDLTPTWVQLLPMWLDMYRQAVVGNCTNPDLVINNARAEFTRMAEAADRWNDYCQSVAIISGEAELEESRRINTFLDPERGNLSEHHEDWGFGAQEGLTGGNA